MNEMVSRRTLLASLAAAAPDRRLRVGIVGGRFGASFHFHEHPNAIVQAVADLRPDRQKALAQTYGCGTTYASLDALLKDRQVEAVGLFTPAPDHVRHAVATLRAGKHVLSAVPAAMTLEECALLVDTVKKTGLTYMMAETSYYQQLSISARRLQQEGKFGKLYHCESEYHHAGLETLFVENGERTWRYGFPPMHYPTHCTAHLLGVVAGERLTHATCTGWGNNEPCLRDNAYGNPFWNETAFFQSKSGTTFRVAVWWKGAHKGAERAEWYGDRLSLISRNPNGLGTVTVTVNDTGERDSGGFQRSTNQLAPLPEPEWWKTDLLPATLRHNSGHEGSHTFLTHEFVDAVIRERRPTVSVWEAVAYTAPGIVAHQSALRGGERLSIPSFD